MSGQPPPPPGQDIPPQPPQPPSPATSNVLPILAASSEVPFPVSRGRGRLIRTLAVVLIVVSVLLVIAFIAADVAGHNSRFTIVSSSSTDGTFKAGDCVSLSTSRVTQATCTGAHDAQIIRVIHAKETCPGGTEEFDVNDGTGNLCLDRGNNAKG
jgi:hypothetical protein